VASRSRAAGRRAAIPDRPGFFFPVTVLENVRSGRTDYDDQLFSPVASIICVADDNEAMRVANPQRPFGGVKESGYRREHGGFGLEQFVNVKSIQVTKVSP
jgi:succinate-semialdehyde dehydrogenase/glutarate-semialdehyde dehydrogenase